MTPPTSTPDFIGAHVSSAGGPQNAPPRGRAIGATAIQIFTKTPNQWRERVITPDEAAEFKTAMGKAGIARAVSHDSYLINLASPDATLRNRSIKAFVAELTRAHVLGLEAVVTHPGNYLDDRAKGLIRNAAAYTKCLRAVESPVMIYLETTAGTGTALGRTFEELQLLRESIAADVRSRVAFCADTCHLYSAGYDIVGNFDGVWRDWDRIIGLDKLRCLHLNDSKTAFDSRRDRHALLGEGTLGPKPFRALMTDPRFQQVSKIIETPKGDDEVTNDRKMLRKLRSYRKTKS